VKKPKSEKAKLIVKALRKPKNPIHDPLFQSELKRAGLA
jgi:hypothetical protein